MAERYPPVAVNCAKCGKAVGAWIAYARPGSRQAVLYAICHGIRIKKYMAIADYHQWRNSQKPLALYAQTKVSQ